MQLLKIYSFDLYDYHISYETSYKNMSCILINGY